MYIWNPIRWLFIFRIWNLLILYFFSKFTKVISSDLVWNECVVWEQSYFRSAPGKKEHKVTRCGLGTISSELYSHWSCNLQAQAWGRAYLTPGYTTIDIWSHFKSKSTCIKQRFCIIFFFLFCHLHILWLLLIIYNFIKCIKYIT